MKTFVFFLLFFVYCFTAASAALADTCSEAFTEFRLFSKSMSSKQRLSYDDLKKVRESYEKLLILTEDQPCYKATLKAIKPNVTELRDKRIETLSKFFKEKNFEEAGTDLINEYAVLTGAKKGSLAFDELFASATPRKPFAPEHYAAIVTSQKEHNLADIKNSACSNIINQNAAVNLENVRNQDGVGWCYAYAAADLLSFRLKEKISAVSLYNGGQSIEYDIQDLYGNGGEIGEAIDKYLSRHNGLCLEKDLPSTDFKFCNFKNYNQFLSFLYKSAKSNTLSDSECLNKNLDNAFPGVNYAVVKNYTDKFGTKNLAEFLFEQKCKINSFSHFKVRPQTLTLPSNKADDLINKMDGLLSKGDVVGLSYNYNVLNETDSSTSGHASIVVGRRQNSATGECEYLIRNSWGKDCTEKEGPGLSCHKNCDATGGNCRFSGHFWASSRRLKNSIKAITFLP